MSQSGSEFTADFKDAIASIPPGRWAVAVSGGADSVALLGLLRERIDLSLHVVHLNHELRGEESDQDAAFVADCADRLTLPSTIARRSALESGVQSPNPSEQYRRARLTLYQKVIVTHHLDGVLLGHHRDDQVETVLHRLLRGSGYRGLCGMAEVDCVAGVALRRPLLNVPREMLRQYLVDAKQDWREDSSNASDRYGRNRLRRFFVDQPALVESLLILMNACRELKRVVDATAVQLPDEVALRLLPAQPDILNQQSIRVWLTDGGVPVERIDRETISRVQQMMHDAAVGAKMQLPGGRSIARRAGKLSFR